MHVLVDCESAISSVQSHGQALPGLVDDVHALRAVEGCFPHVALALQASSALEALDSRPP